VNDNIIVRKVLLSFWPHGENHCGFITLPPDLRLCDDNGAHNGVPSRNSICIPSEI